MSAPPPPDQGRGEVAIPPDKSDPAVPPGSSKAHTADDRLDYRTENNRRMLDEALSPEAYRPQGILPQQFEELRKLNVDPNANSYFSSPRPTLEPNPCGAQASLFQVPTTPTNEPFREPCMQFRLPPINSLSWGSPGAHAAQYMHRQASGQDNRGYMGFHGHSSPNSSHLMYRNHPWEHPSILTPSSRHGTDASYGMQQSNPNHYASSPRMMGSPSFVAQPFGSFVGQGSHHDTNAVQSNMPVDVNGYPIATPPALVREYGIVAPGHLISPPTPSPSNRDGRRLSVKSGIVKGSKKDGEKRHICYECDPPKELKRAHNLKIHARIHTGEKPFRCPHNNCDKSFKWKSCILSHLNWHGRKGQRIPSSVALKFKYRENVIEPLSELSTGPSRKGGPSNTRKTSHRVLPDRSEGRSMRNTSSHRAGPSRNMRSQLVNAHDNLDGPGISPVTPENTYRGVQASLGVSYASPRTPDTRPIGIPRFIAMPMPRLQAMPSLDNNPLPPPLRGSEDDYEKFVDRSSNNSNTHGHNPNEGGQNGVHRHINNGK